MLRPVELVGLPELMHEPDDLVRMVDQVRRELRRDHEVRRRRAAGEQIDEPPHQPALEQPLVRPRLERHADDVRLVPASPELRDQLVREDLGASAHERLLRAADGDPHTASLTGARLVDEPHRGDDRLPRRVEPVQRVRVEAELALARLREEPGPV